MGPFKPFVDGVQGFDSQGYAGPVPGKASGAPGKSTLTGKIPPRHVPGQAADPNIIADRTDQRFIEQGTSCSADPSHDGCIWEGSDAEGIRMRVGLLISMRLPIMVQNMHAALGRLLLDAKLAKAPPSLALMLIGGGFDFLSFLVISRIGAFAKSVTTAASVAQGVSEATGQDVSMFVRHLSNLSPKQVETVAKTLSGVMKDKVKKAVEHSANYGFDSNRAARVTFLQQAQNGLGAMATDMISRYTEGSDVDALVLLAMLEHCPDVDGFEEQYRDKADRFQEQEIANIGKSEGISNAKHRVVRVAAYGQEIYLHVLTAGGKRVGAPLRTTGAGGQNKDYVEPDDPAKLVAIISPDLVAAAVANNGGTVEEVPMTWEAYRGGKSPVPTLDMLDRADWPMSTQGRFKAWLLGAYKEAHKGQMPPDDPFWFASLLDNDDKSAKPPVAASQPIASSAGDVDVVTTGAVDVANDAFNLF